VVEVEPADPRCLSLSGAFPPGLDELPGAPGLAAIALFQPASVLTVDLESVPPAVASPGPVPGLPADSDGDGLDDREALIAVGRPPLDLNLAAILAAGDGLVLAAASGYEEVVFVEPLTGTLRTVEVETPPGLDPLDAPFLPAPGSSAVRTAVSTSLCVRPGPAALDSLGLPVGAGCDPAVPSFETNFTSGVALAAGRLFVSSSNFVKVGSDPQLHPGSVLVYELDLGVDPPRVALDATRPVLFTTAFNPTGLTSYTTPGGNGVVLVHGTGAITVGTGVDLPLTPSSIDVIDAATRRIVASVPLGAAALSSAGLAVHPSGRVAVGGSLAFRHLFVADLAPVDEAIAVHDDGDPPILLDGSDARLPFDARVFDAAAPLEFPGVANGAPADRCAGAVFGVAFNRDGSKLFATDFCDGVLAAVGIDVTGAPLHTPLPATMERFQLLSTQPVTQPNDPARFPDAPAAPGRLLVRAGIPGVDFRGPDVFVLVGLPEGLLCGVRIDSF
jgi:hypothetical protein